MSFAPGDLSADGFLGGRLIIRQPVRGYRAATDPVFLAAFAPVRAGEAVLDLGCGAGTAGLCLATRLEGLDLHGLELQPDYAALARQNAAANGLGLTVHHGDLLDMPASLRRRSFDHVIMNPPFYGAGQVTPPADPGRDTAHREGIASLGDWIAAGLRRLAPKGRLVIIHRTERLAEILAALSGPAGEIEILPLAPREGRAANRVLVRARRLTRGPLVLHAPLVIHEGPSHEEGGGTFTGRAAAILRDGAPICLG